MLEGGFRPSGLHREWCDAEILRQIRRKSLASCAEKSSPSSSTRWPASSPTGRVCLRRGAAVPHISMRCSMPSRICRARRFLHRCSKSSILPARIAGYDPAGLDTLIAAGEVAWAGVEPIGERDGRIALYLADKLPLAGAVSGPSANP